MSLGNCQDIGVPRILYLALATYILHRKDVRGAWANVASGWHQGRHVLETAGVGLGEGTHNTKGARGRARPRPERGDRSFVLEGNARERAHCGPWRPARGTMRIEPERE